MLCLSGRTLVYWKKKHKMAKQKFFKWHELSNLKEQTHIKDEEHTNTDPQFIKKSLRHVQKK
jgi:hypothetical protein